MHKTYSIKLLRNIRIIVLSTVMFITAAAFTLYLPYNFSVQFLIITAVPYAILIVLFFAIIKMSDQKITMNSDGLTICFGKKDSVILKYSELSFAGKFIKNENRPISFNDGVYVYSESRDYYFFIGYNFDKIEDIAADMELLAKDHNFKWHNIQRKNKNSLVAGIRKLLQQ